MDPAQRTDPSRRASGCRKAAVRPGECGVLATRSYRPGEIVLVFGGPLLPRDSIQDFKHCLEIADGLFLGPSGEVDDFVNHSCDPNCRVELQEQRATLVALREIAAGDEVTYDYSTMMRRDPTSFGCHCGSPACRGVVRPFHTLPAELRRAYRERGMVPDFVV